MKRVFAVLLCALLLLSSTAFSEIDYASMTDEELKQVIIDAQAELDRRSGDEQDPEGFFADRVLFDIEGVRMYLTGEYTVKESFGNMRFYVEVVVENNSSQNLGCMPSGSFSVNGWTGKWDAPSIPPPGNKTKGKLTFDMEAASISTFEEIKEVEIVKPEKKEKVVKAKKVKNNNDKLEWLEIKRNGTKYEVMFTERIIINDIKDNNFKIALQYGAFPDRPYEACSLSPTSIHHQMI